jgi:hypothetical protein
VLGVYEGLDWSGGLVIQPYILYACFIEQGIGFAEFERIFEKEGFVWLADWEGEGCRQCGFGSIEKTGVGYSRGGDSRRGGGGSFTS